MTSHTAIYEFSFFQGKNGLKYISLLFLITSGKLTSVNYDITNLWCHSCFLCSDVIEKQLWHHRSNLWCHSCFSSHMTSHTLNYDVICRYLWCHMPLLHTYDIIGHCMWCHRSCNLFVIYDVIVQKIVQMGKSFPETCLWHHIPWPMTS